MKLVAIFSNTRTYPIEYSSKEELVDLLTTTADSISKLRHRMVTLSTAKNAAETKLHDLWEDLPPSDIKNLLFKIKQFTDEYNAAESMILDSSAVKCGSFIIDATWKVNLPRIYTIDEWFEALKNRLQ